MRQHIGNDSPWVDFLYADYRTYPDESGLYLCRFKGAGDMVDVHGEKVPTDGWVTTTNIKITKTGFGVRVLDFPVDCEETVKELRAWMKIPGETYRPANGLQISANSSKATDDELAFLDDIIAELGRARAKFQEPDITMAAFNEEAGELTKAVLDEPRANIRKEALQVCATAMRLVFEGDNSLVAWRRLQGLDSMVPTSVHPNPKKKGKTPQPKAVVRGSFSDDDSIA